MRDDEKRCLLACASSLATLLHQIDDGWADWGGARDVAKDVAADLLRMRDEGETIDELVESARAEWEDGEDD